MVLPSPRDSMKAAMNSKTGMMSPSERNLAILVSTVHSQNHHSKGFLIIDGTAPDAEMARRGGSRTGDERRTASTEIF